MLNEKKHCFYCLYVCVHMYAYICKYVFMFGHVLHMHVCVLGKHGTHWKLKMLRI